MSRVGATAETVFERVVGSTGRTDFDHVVRVALDNKFLQEEHYFGVIPFVLVYSINDKAHFS